VEPMEDEDLEIINAFNTPLKRKRGGRGGKQAKLCVRKNFKRMQRRAWKEGDPLRAWSPSVDALDDAYRLPPKKIGQKVGFKYPIKRAKPKTEKRTRTRKHSPGEQCPWWRTNLEALYKTTPRATSDTTPQPSTLVVGEGKQHRNTWFSVNSMKLGHASNGPTEDVSWRECMHIEDPLDIWSQENGSDKRSPGDARNKASSSKPIKQERCRKAHMRLTRQQQRVLKQWGGAYRLTYNKAVELVRKDSGWTDAECTYLNEHLVNKGRVTDECRAEKTSVVALRKAEGALQSLVDQITGISKDTLSEEQVESLHKAEQGVESAEAAVITAVLKTEAMRRKRTRLGVEVGHLLGEHPWLEEVPSNVRKEACRDVEKAEKSNKGRRVTKPGHRWTLKFKQRSIESAWTFTVPTHHILAAGIAPRPETEKQASRHAKRKRKDDKRKRNWTWVDLPKVGRLWLTEELPVSSFGPLRQQGSSKRPGFTFAHAVQITLNRRGRFHMCVTHSIDPTPPTTKPLRERVVGVNDPGDRTKATVYSPSTGEVLEYADEERGRKQLEDLAFKVDSLVDKLVKGKAYEKASEETRVKLKQRIRELQQQRDSIRSSRATNKDANVKLLRVAIRNEVQSCFHKEDGSTALTPSQRRKLLKQIAVLRQRSKDLVKEAHRKIVRDWVRRFDTFVHPPFNTKEMVQRETVDSQGQKRHRTVNARVAKSLLSFSHRELKVHAMRVFLQEGKEFLMPDEKYTTMNCEDCGILNEVGSKKKWTCTHCGRFHLRDPAASRCIFLKTLGGSRASTVAASLAATTQRDSDESPSSSDTGAAISDMEVDDFTTTLGSSSDSANGHLEEDRGMVQAHPNPTLLGRE